MCSRPYCLTTLILLGDSISKLVNWGRCMTLSLTEGWMSARTGDWCLGDQLTTRLPKPGGPRMRTGVRHITRNCHDHSRYMNLLQQGGFQTGFNELFQGTVEKCSPSIVPSLQLQVLLLSEISPGFQRPPASPLVNLITLAFKDALLSVNFVGESALLVYGIQNQVSYMKPYSRMAHSSIGHNQSSAPQDADVTVEALLAMISMLSITPHAVKQLSDAVQKQVSDSADHDSSSTKDLGACPPVSESISVTRNTRQPATAGQIHPMPNGHYSVTYNGITFVLPLQEESGPFYLITRGRLVGVIAQWARVCPLVIGVSGAAFHMVSSMQWGWQMIEAAIDDGLTRVL
ncbi:hypothetical protein PAXINDRAFT_153324 [Paxillus involutus ATCC 200175]|nr:hypothetical protein PAXINDRAFT_153324 [Paxillus involutus ATCC 200175]